MISQGTQLVRNRVAFRAVYPTGRQLRSPGMARRHSREDTQTQSDTRSQNFPGRTRYFKTNQHKNMFLATCPRRKGFPHQTPVLARGGLHPEGQSAGRDYRGPAIRGQPRVSITLLPEANKDTTRKESYRPISLMNTNVILNKLPANIIQ